MENKYSLVFITGAMTSGKSKFLIDHIKFQERYGFKVLKFKPRKDTRDLYEIRSREYSEGIPAHGISWELIPTFSADYLETVDLIVVDEAQFLDLPSYKHIVQMAKGYNKPLIMCGLTWNFKLEMIPIISKMLKEEKPKIITLYARCFRCKEENATNSIKVSGRRIVWEGRDIDCQADYKAICDNCLNILLKNQRMKEGRC